jgi:hypothetical protein
MELTLSRSRNRERRESAEASVGLEAFALRTMNHLDLIKRVKSINEATVGSSSSRTYEGRSTDDGRSVQIAIGVLAIGVSENSDRWETQLSLSLTSFEQCCEECTITRMVVGVPYIYEPTIRWSMALYPAG